MRPRTGRTGAQIPAGNETKDGKNRGSNPGRGKLFFSKIQTSSRAHPASNIKDTEDSVHGDTAAGPGVEN